MTKRCRLCLETNAEDYYSLHEEYKAGPTYADFIQQLAGVEIEFDDGLPQEICEECYCEIQRILEFGSGVRRADEELRNELYSVKREKDNPVLENEYYTHGNEICAMEEVLELDTDNHESFVVEEIHEGEEIHLVEEILGIDNEVITDEVIIDDVITEEDTKPCLQKEDLLVKLAHVAATQDNVDVIDKNATSTEEYSKDENDEDYLIEFDPNETLSHNFKPPKWKCGECKVVLRGDVSYEGHMNMHKQLRPHKCVHCNWDFRCRAALKKHQETRHTSRTNLELTVQEKKIQTSSFCEECKIPFDTEVKCYLHEIMVHKKYTDISTCPFCSNIVENIKEHIQKSHNNDYNIENAVNNDNTLNSAYTSTATVWQCSICSKIYHSLEVLSNHQKLCQKTDEQQTQDIKVVYLDDIPISSNVEYLEDVTTTNAKDSSENESVQCEICKRKLLRRNLIKHMELHNRKDKEDEARKYLCAHCHISFTTDEDLNDHFNSEHLAASHMLECKQCHVSFADLKLLKEHGKINHKYKCKLCGNTFRGHAQLSAHKRLHKERPFKCDQCDKAYPRKVELDIHIRTHTGELPYACHLCDKRFAVKVRLTYHLQKHEGVTHPCPYCSAVYDNRNKLKAHLFKHTGMPYICELCPGLGFDRRIRFANHMQRMHKKTLTEEELSEIFAKNTGKTVHFKDPGREK